MTQRPTAPAGGVRPLFRSLSLSLFLWLFGMVIVAFAAYAFLNVRTTSEQWQKTLSDNALRWSELIKRSTHYGMLLNRKEDVHQIIETVARTPGVEGVRIYDKQGVIIFSADAAEIGRQVDLKAEACILCHGSASPLTSVPTESRIRVFRGADGERVLGLINPIANEPACSQAACHAHPPDKTVLGVLDVKVSMAEADRRLAATERLNIGAAVLMALAVGAFSAVFIDRVVRRPVNRLIAGTERVARGDLTTTLEPGPANEIGRLARAFNLMTGDLKRAEQENADWARKLERKVVEKTEELSRAQRQVVHMEKMASLGKLSATVAHELNNPLAGILNYAKLINRSLTEGEEATEGKAEGDALDRRGEIGRFLSVIEKESRRCGDIVKNLLLFARRSGAELALHPLNPIVERALMLIRHHLEMSNIQLETRLAPGDLRIVCDADQIQQALVALLVNAVEAMSGGGTLTVEVAAVDEGGAGAAPAGAVALTVADTGVGIPPAALPHIFEPFFSTKDGTSGAGLGLAVVYGIVQRHGGTIDVDSEPGRGTRFRMVLPRHPPAGGEAGKESAA
jgi:two-component system, NtrC family, sensor kinase